MNKKDKTKKKKSITIIIVSVILLIASPFICVAVFAGFQYYKYSSIVEEVASPHDEKTSTVESVEEKEGIIHKVGLDESVDLNGVIWTLNSTRDAGSSMDYLDEYLPEFSDSYEWEDTCNATEGYKYVVLGFTVENNSSSFIQVYEESLFSINAEEFESETFLYSCVSNLIYFSRDVIEGDIYDFSAIYEVPYEIKDFKYLLNELSYSDDEVVFDISFN